MSNPWGTRIPFGIDRVLLIVVSETLRSIRKGNYWVRVVTINGWELLGVSYTFLRITIHQAGLQLVLMWRFCTSAKSALQRHCSPKQSCNWQLWLAKLSLQSLPLLKSRSGDELWVPGLSQSCGESADCVHVMGWGMGMRWALGPPTHCLAE